MIRGSERRKKKRNTENETTDNCFFLGSLCCFSVFFPPNDASMRLLSTNECHGPCQLASLLQSCCTHNCIPHTPFLCLSSYPRAPTTLSFSLHINTTDQQPQRPTHPPTRTTEVSQPIILSFQLKKNGIQSIKGTSAASKASPSAPPAGPRPAGPGPAGRAPPAARRPS